MSVVKHKEKERSGEGDYPRLRISMLSLDGPVRFEVEFSGYFQLCRSVFHAIAPNLSNTALAQFRIAPFMAYCFGLLAKRLWQILKDRSTSGVSHAQEPAVPVSIIPRPIYIYLASLGDFVEADLGVRFELDVSSSTIQDMVATAHNLAIGGDEFENLRIYCVGSEQNGFAIFLLRLLNRMGSDPPIERLATADEIRRFIVEEFRVTAEQSIFIHNLLLGWYNEPNPFVRGVQDVAGINHVNAEIRAVIVQFVEAIMRFTPRGFAYVRHSNIIPALVLPQQFLSVLQAQVPKRYRCAVVLPTTSVGVRSQLCYAAPSTLGNQTIAYSPFPLAPTYIGVAIACGFRYDQYSIFRLGGFTTIPFNETISQIRDGWAVSNVLGH